MFVAGLASLLAGKYSFRRPHLEEAMLIAMCLSQATHALRSCVVSKRVLARLPLPLPVLSSVVVHFTLRQ